jgi:glycerophosphoryl diester phosphodiesterase
MIFLTVVLISVLCFAFAQDSYSNGAWRKSLDGDGACWNDRSCKRVMTSAHGGEWNFRYPYDSMPAFQRADSDGADAVKGDFRVAKDNVGVVMHSSPVEFYESLNCRGKLVEEMTSAECAKCQMEVTQYKFLTVPDFLSWADNKVNVMFCVKKSADIPRAISSLIEYGASHRAFLEVHTDDFLDLEKNQTPHWDEVYYVVEMHTHEDLMNVLASSEVAKMRAILLEFNSWEDWKDVETDVQLAKQNGFRTFAASKDNPITATVDNHLRLYNAGFDVAYTYNLTNAVEARIKVNSLHRITPP